MGSRALAVAAGLAVFIGMVIPSSAQPAAARHGCHLSGATVALSSAEAVVFRRRKPFGNVYYACYRHKGAIYRLNSKFENAFSPVRPLRLAGRFVGYLDYNEGPTGDDTLINVAVRDLVTGVVVQDSPNSESGVSQNVQSFVLNRKGSGAWITKDYANPRFPSDHPWEYQVWVIDRETAATLDSPPGRGSVIARGQDIDPHSLTLSPSGRTITWYAGGSIRSAALR